jgi:acetyl-CoA synthetase (ADP-forming)
VVWHTQGPGKLIEMLLYAAKIMRSTKMGNPTLVLITDRNDLDDQLYAEVFAPARILPESPKQAGSRAEMRTLLDRSSGGIMFTTIQKFAPDAKGGPHPLLTDRRNVVVIPDEARRSQYDFLDGYARHLHDALPSSTSPALRRGRGRIGGLRVGSPTVPSHTLSESDSKALLAGYGVPVVPERLVTEGGEARRAGEELGYPVVAKLCGDAIAHKTERGLVRLSLRDGDALGDAVDDLLGRATPEDGDVAVLVAPMVSGARELIAGMQRDPQFGPTVLVGIGGVVAEALADVAIRLAPLERVDAAEMLDDLAARKLLDAFRGEPPVDRDAMAEVLLGLARLAADRPDVRSVDLNPLIIADGRPIAVDALVEVEG